MPRKQSKTIANFYHTQGNYPCPNAHKTKLSMTYIETTCQEPF